MPILTYDQFTIGRSCHPSLIDRKNQHKPGNRVVKNTVSLSYDSASQSLVANLHLQWLF